MNALELIFCTALVHAAGVGPGWRLARRATNYITRGPLVNKPPVAERVTPAIHPSQRDIRGHALIEHLRFDLGEHLCNLHR